MDLIPRSCSFSFLPTAMLVLAMLVAVPGCEQNTATTETDDASVETRDDAQRTPLSPEQQRLTDRLFTAIIDDNEARAIELVEEGASVHGRDHRGIPVLHFAARATMPDLTRVLLESGADVNVDFENNTKPIHWAARAGASDRVGAEETIDVLLEYGADINARTDAGTTPITYAVQLGNERWQDFMISRGAVLD